MPNKTNFQSILNNLRKAAFSERDKGDYLVTVHKNS